MINENFYDSFAKDYNRMIPLEKQIESKKNIFSNFLSAETKTAADLGTGSGADSIALTKLGLQVKAFEPSSQMIKRAKKNFSKTNVEVDIYKNKVGEINASFHNSFDLVISFGNTFANINRDEIKASIEKVINLLKPNGKAFIQILNYDKILKEKERIVNITGSDEKQFIRFYDFCDGNVFFNILSFNKNELSNRKLITTEIFPYTHSFWQGLNQANDCKMEFFGDADLKKFEKSTSPNLIIKINKCRE